MGSKIRMMPHRTAAPSSLIWGSWSVSTGAEFQAASTYIRGWDFSTECILRAEVVIDAASLLSSTGLLTLQDVLLVAQVECSSTFFRATNSTFLTANGGSSHIVDVSLPPGQCASQISASLHLVLGRDLHSQEDPTIASHIGARLASSDVTRLELGAKASLFPTEALDFSGSLPANVPWVMNVTYEDLDDAFLGAARLFVNTAHPGGRVALDDAHPNASTVRSALRVDVVRSLILQVASHERSVFDAAREYDSESIGQVVASFCKHALKADLTSVARMIVHDPIEFEARLHASFGYLQQVEGVH